MSEAESTLAGSTWQVGGASALGASHARRKQPNQDAVRWAPEAGQGRRVVVAVSDGHGAAPHYRSEVGSRLAVEAAEAVLLPFLDGAPSEAAAAALPERIVSAWRQSVLRHVAAHPLVGSWVESEADKLLPYGATLVAVAAGEGLLAIVQIGDGDILLGHPDGGITRPLPNDVGMVGEQTYSLCTDDAAERFRVRLILPHDAAGWPDFIMLSTDGVAKSFADEDAFRSVAEHYRAALDAADLPALRAELPGWLADVSRRGSGDDATLALVKRIGGAPAGAVPHSQQETDDVW